MRSELSTPLVWDLRQIGGDCLYKIAHSWLDPMVNPVQTALGCPLRTEALRAPLTGLSVEIVLAPLRRGFLYVLREGSLHK